MSPDLASVTRPSEIGMQWLVLFTAYFLLGLFLIGVFDLLVGLYDLIVTGRFIDPIAVVELLDTVLLLLIIVEVHRTLLAYVRNEPVIRIVVGAAIIAVAREIISFRIDDFETGVDALTGAVAFAVLLLILTVTYFSIRRDEPDRA